MALRLQIMERPSLTLHFLAESGLRWPDMKASRGCCKPRTLRMCLAVNGGGEELQVLGFLRCSLTRFKVLAQNTEAAMFPELRPIPQHRHFPGH